ncbi:MAG: AI-2E family transporter [Actinomycetota bacterium]
MAARTEPSPTNGTVARIVLIVAAVSVGLYIVYSLRNVLILIVVAGFLAIGLDPGVRKLEGLGMKRGQAVAAIFVTAILFIAAFTAAVIPPLVSQVATFATNLPGYVEDLAESNPRIEEWVKENDVAEQLKSAAGNVPKVIGSSFGDALGIAGSVAGALFNGLTILVLTIYFSLSLSRIREGSMKLVPKSKRSEVKRFMDPVLEKIGGYIAGQVSVALLAGVLALIFLAVAGVPFPVALALWVSLSALIPLVGATLGAIPAAIVAFFTSVPLGIATFVYFLVYQQVENYIIAPRIMTKAVDISPAAVLLAALIGGNLLGFVGALMAIPAAASIKLFAQEIFVPKAETA